MQLDSVSGCCTRNRGTRTVATADVCVVCCLRATFCRPLRPGEFRSLLYGHGVCWPQAQMQEQTLSWTDNLTRLLQRMKEAVSEAACSICIHAEGRFPVTWLSFQTYSVETDFVHFLQGYALAGFPCRSSQCLQDKKETEQSQFFARRSGRGGGLVGGPVG